MNEPKQDQKKELKKSVADKYDLEKGTAIVSYFPRFGEIDLSELTVEAADSLVERGFKWLKAKSKPQTQSPKS